MNPVEPPEDPDVQFEPTPVTAPVGAAATGMTAAMLLRSIALFVVAGLMEIGGGYLVWLWLREGRGPIEPERLIRYAAATVLAFVALGKVLSPQFLIWLVPLVPLVAGRRGLAASALLAAALVLTQLWFPSRYWEYAGGLDGTLTALVLARDLVLVAALVVLVVPLRR